MILRASVQPHDVGETHGADRLAAIWESKADVVENLVEVQRTPAANSPTIPISRA